QGDARATLAARLRGRPAFAVERPGEDPGAAGLPTAARPGEEIGMVEPAAAQRLHQRFGDVLLPDDLGERARPVLAVQRQCHGYKLPPGSDEPASPWGREGPPCTRQSPLILAAFRPWGGSQG